MTGGVMGRTIHCVKENGTMVPLSKGDPNGSTATGAVRGLIGVTYAHTWTVRLIVSKRISVSRGGLRPPTGTIRTWWMMRCRQCSSARYVRNVSSEEQRHLIWMATNIRLWWNIALVAFHMHAIQRIHHLISCINQRERSE